MKPLRVSYDEFFYAFIWCAFWDLFDLAVCQLITVRDKSVAMAEFLSLISFGRDCIPLPLAFESLITSVGTNIYVSDKICPLPCSLGSWIKYSRGLCPLPS